MAPQVGFAVQGESDPPGQDLRFKRQGRHETLTPLGATYGEVDLCDGRQLLLELSHVPRGLTGIAQAKEVRKNEPN